MGDPGSFADPFRPQNPITLPVAVVSAGAAALTYAAMSAALTVYFDFFRVTSNWLVPLLIVAMTSLVLVRVGSRRSSLIAAAVAPLVAVTLGLLVAGPPYIAQNLGISHTFGHLLLALGPAITSVVLVARLRPPPPLS